MELFQKLPLFLDGAGGVGGCWPVEAADPLAVLANARTRKLNLAAVTRRHEFGWSSGEAPAAV